MLASSVELSFAMGRQCLYVNDRGDCVVHDNGFSWFAAIAMPIWALHKRLYLFAVIMVVVGGTINLYADQDTQLVLFVVQFVLYGWLANRVHRWLLERRGWRVTAEEPEQSSGGT